jgi:hypothetical protein
MKKKLLSVVLAAVLAALAGISSTSVSAQPDQTWSVAVHLAYADGTEYDIVLVSGVPTSQMSSMLADCGRSHYAGSVVRYHCYPIPE